ncbi:putative AlkP superfamily pyrophosphatase or phosphodiesterase [Polymorphobacter fuscus]|nr:putative AlkP superfamily pyrophosphatase or phosphodiesterase [Polymorphobacter fuscus]
MIRTTTMIALLLLAGCAARAPRLADVAAPTQRPPVILISVDGLRADYLTRGVTPNISALAASGVRATAMRPSFPSLTFPNHYTLVTGMRPDNHGIVNNTMEDPRIPGVRFSLSNRAAVEDPRWWNEAEPIWVTAEKAGLKTATMFWPGSEAAIHGVRPTQWLPFDGKLPNSDRVAQILAWVDQPARPAFMTLYLDTVDHDGHEFGPDAPETVKALAEVDAQIGALVAGLKARSVAANIVLVSDHGMASVAPERVVRLDLTVPAGSFRTVSTGAVAGLEPMPGQGAVLASALKRPHPHMTCWPRGAIPARLHYGHNPRVPSFVCLAQPGWMILDRGPSEDKALGGMHGYDPAAPEMAASFVAAGPAFRPGTVVAPFDNVDVYPVLTRLLGITPLPSDGKDRLAQAILR